MSERHTKGYACLMGEKNLSRGSHFGIMRLAEGHSICLSIPYTNDGFFFLHAVMLRSLIFILFT